MLAADVLGDESLLADMGACEAPVPQQVERLRLVLDQQWGGGYDLSMAELEDLDDTERHAVLDAIVKGEQSPFVVVNGTLVCQGGVDTGAILAARA